MMVRRSSLVLGLGLFVLMGLSGVSHGFATTPGNNSGSTPPDPVFPIAVVLGTTYATALDSASYDNSVGALTQSVSLREYAVTGPATISISVSDLFFVGDYYSIYEDTDGGFASPAPTLVGTTPQVETGASLKALSYNPLWDGGGSTFSAGTFVVTIGSGTTYFVVVDDLFAAMGSALDAPCATTTDNLLAVGCAASGITVLSPFSPAGYSITFNTATSTGVPQFGAPPVVAAAIILPLLALLRSRRVLASHP